jgi:hypothetical protein
MTLRELLADAREAARLEATYRKLKREYVRGERRKNFRKHPAVHLVLSLVLFPFQLVLWTWPALPGALALLPGGPGWTRAKWGVLAVWAFFFLSGGVISFFSQLGGIGAITPFDALRMPSREGLLLARWVKKVPYLGWCGISMACLTGASLAHFADPWAWDSICLLIAAGLTPLASALHQGYLARSGEETSHREGMLRRGFGDLFVLWYLLLCFNVFRPVLPWSQFSWVQKLGPVALILLPIWICFFLREQLRAVDRCPVGSPVWYERDDWTSLDRAVSAPRVLCGIDRRWKPGRGLLRAEWERFVASFFRGLPSRKGLLRPKRLLRLPGALLELVLRAAWLARGPILGAGAVLASDPTLGIILALGAALLASKVLDPLGWAGTREGERLYLWGVDLRDQVLLDIKAVVFFCALPTIGAAVAAAVLSGPSAPRLALVFLLASAFLLRVGWYGILNFSELSNCGCALEVLVAAALGLFLLFRHPSPDAQAVASAACVTAAVGALGVFRRFRRLGEGTLRAEMRKQAGDFR